MRISDWSSDVCSSDLYSYFDTLVNDYMIRFGGLDMVNDPVIGLVVETACRFHQSIGFPETIEACLRTAKLGNSSVRHEIGLFRDGQPHPAATGHFVDRKSVVQGKSVSVRVDLGGRRIIKQKKNNSDVSRT